MHDLEKQTFEYIGYHHLFEKGDRVVVGVSGGPDSVALLHVLVVLRDELGLDLWAAYLDHGLRPDKETRSEKVLVEKLAEELGVGFRADRAEVRGLSAEQGRSLEDMARELRYSFLQELAGEIGAGKIAVAHHADDQVEELLLRLLRGTGRSGLAGMSPINFRKVVRPFLSFTKRQLLEYLRDRDITYLEDSSNRDLAFLRNRIRIDLIPYLKKNYNPNIEQTLLRTSEVLAREDGLLEDLTIAGFEDAVKTGKDLVWIDRDKLGKAHPAIGRRVVDKAIALLGGQASFHHIEKIMEMAAGEVGGSELHLAGGLRAVRVDGKIELSFPAGRKPHRQSRAESRVMEFETVVEGPGTWLIPGLAAGLEFDIIDQAPTIEELKKMESDYLDISGLNFPFLVRSPRPGDRFHPLGGPGSRKVADFLSDRKIPRDSRWRVPVLAKDDKVMALLGLRIDHDYRLKEKSTKVLKVRIIA